MVDLTTITSSNLDQALGKFYAEATPKQSIKRKIEMTTECALGDNINSYKASRFIKSVPAQNQVISYNLEIEVIFLPYVLC